MKIMVKYIYVSIVMILVFVAFSIMSKAESFKEEVTTKVLEQRCSYIIKTELLTIYEDELIYIVNNNNIQKIKGNIVEHIIANDDIYMLVKDDYYYLYKVNNNSLQIDFMRLTLDTANDLDIYNNEVVVVGKLDDNASISIVNLNLKDEMLKTLNGEGYQEFTQIVVSSNYIYVGGIKSAHSNNEYYLNVGSSGELKSFIFQFNQLFEIVNSCYFNEGYNVETIKTIVNYNDGISVMLNSDKCYLYELSSNLECINKKEILNKRLIEIETTKLVNNNHIYIYPSGEMTLLCYYDSNHSLCTFYELEGEYIDHYMEKGHLHIYYNYDEATYKLNLSEYHIEYSNTLVCDYFNFDETNLNHFLVDSYFEDLEFTQYLITPYFARNIHGEYTSKYVAKKEDGGSIYHETPLIVKPYLNVLDGGIYPKGYRLYYFGTAKLNGENIINGTELNKVGINELVLTSANGKDTTYSFRVVDGYYNSDKIINTEYDIEALPNQEIFIPLYTNENIESVIVNGQEIRNFRLVNDMNYLVLTASKNQNITNYVVEKINYSDGKVELINTSIIIKTLYDEITFNIYEHSENGYLTLDIDTIDKTKNIKDVYLEIYQQNELVETINTYILDSNFILDNYLEDITIKLKVDTLDNKTYTLFTYVGNIKKLTPIEGNIKFIIEEGYITQIKFQLNLSSHNLIHHKILLSDTPNSELVSKYQVTKSKIIIYLSIALGVVIIIVSIILIKRKKKKQINI